MSAMNFWVARARRRWRGRGVRGEGGRPARRRWCDVTASGIWMQAQLLEGGLFGWFWGGWGVGMECERSKVNGGMVRVRGAG